MNDIKYAYLTIDDSPTEDMIERIDFLNSLGINAIWFSNGNKLLEDEKSPLYAIENGHIIGNHSFDHPFFSKISIDNANKQIDKTDQIISKIYKKSSKEFSSKYFRFPYLDNGVEPGYQDTDWQDTHVKAIQKKLKELGYRQPNFEGIEYEWYKKAGFDSCLNVDCTYDTYDWTIDSPSEGYHDRETILARLNEDFPNECRGLNSKGSNEIIMMHSWIPLDLFKSLITNILKKGIVFKKIT